MSEILTYEQMDEFIEEVTAYVRRILLSHDLVCFVNYRNEFLAIFLNLYFRWIRACSCSSVVLLYV
jgi:hypothetical protein